MNDTNRDDSGRGELRDRLPPLVPPPDLEGRVRSTLEARGLVRSPNVDRLEPPPNDSAARRRSPWLARVGLVAAGLMAGLLAGGMLTGNTLTSGAPRPLAPAPAAGQYVLLLYGDPPGDTGAVHVAREREYGRWASSLTDARWVGGSELADVVARLGPSAEATQPASDRLAGYFVIGASSRERATAVARSCPHLKYGGRVVVMAVAS